MKIIQAREEDVFEIMDILNYSIVNETARFDEEAINLAEMKSWMKEHNKDYPIFCALDDDKVIGWASISPFNKKSAFRYTVENSIYIHKNYRGKGVGNKLLERLIEESRVRGYKAIIALITGNNQSSIKLHEKYGFTNTGIMKDVGFKFGTWLDVAILELILC